MSLDRHPTNTALCRECDTFVPLGNAVEGTYRSDDGTVFCEECKA